MKKLLAGLVLLLTAVVSFGQGVRIQWATTNTGPTVSNIVILLSSNLMPNRLSATNPNVSQLRVYAATNQNTPGFWLDPTTITPGAATNTYELTKTGTGLTLDTNGLLYTLGLNLPLSNVATNSAYYLTNIFQATLFMQNPASPTFWTLGNPPDSSSTLGLSIGGGQNLLGPHTGEVIIGGTQNYASGDRAVIIGASQSTNESDYASGIYGGRFNYVGDTEVAQILGGIYNRWEAGDDGAIVGGMANTNSDGQFGVILGGRANSLGAEENGFILGGTSNRITAGLRTGIVGGRGNLASANDSYIFGGYGNTVSGTNSIVIGSGMTITPASSIALGFGSEFMSIDSSKYTTTFPWYFANGASGMVTFFRDTPSGIEMRIDADLVGLNVVGIAQAAFDLSGGENFTMFADRFQTTAPWYFANGASGVVPFFRDTPSGIELRIDADDARMQLIGADALVLDSTARYVGNGSGLTNILEAALVYPAANPAAGLVLTSTSSNTAAWLAPTGGAGGGGPLSGGFTNGAGQITASGHTMTLNDPGTGWTNLNWTDQTLSTDDTNVFDWFNKYLIGTWTVTSGNFYVGSGNSASGSRGFISGANNVIGSSGINNGFIGGGTDNFLDAGSSGHTSMFGGQQNTNLSLFNGVLVGGRYNKIFALSTGGESLLGGVSNAIGGTYSTVTGGRTNTVFGNYSIALGGLLNVVSNNFATAGGFKTRAMHEGSWIWADHSLDDETVTTTSNSFNVRANGGVYMQSTNGFHLTGSPLYLDTGAVATGDTLTVTNATTSEYAQIKPGSVFGTNETGATFLLTNGFFYGNSVFLKTNLATSLALTAGKAYFTNLAGNIVLTDFVDVPADSLWSIYLVATNATASTFSITFPNGVIGAGNGNPAVYYLTNGTRAEWQVNGWARTMTNVNWSPHW